MITAFAGLISAQSTSVVPTTTTAVTTATVTTATVTTTVTSTATPTCQPQYDCSTSPKGCLNSGTCENSVCKCMPGFGGNDCSLLACGSPLIDPSQRTTVTSNSSCPTCDAGFGGFNCNVCETDAGCQSKTPTRTSFLGNENMVCNKKTEVFYDAFMSCAVRAPALTSFFPGNYTLTLDLNPINKTVNAQLWLGQIEQFFCKAPNCTVATTEQSGAIQTKWDCPVLDCTCITPTV
ncbi:hypothetical protein BGZ58_000174, partial [Dissophora ornata]